MKIIIFFLFFVSGVINSLSVGSITAVSVQSCPVFPSGDTNNIMLGFASFENGFQLTNSVTTCTFDSEFPVSGNINLAGGALYLNKNLMLDNPIIFNQGGIIYGNKNNFEFSSTFSQQLIPINTTGDALRFYDTVIKMNSAIKLGVDWKFGGQCKIKGNGNTLSLAGNYSCMMYPGAQVTFEDVNLIGLKNSNLQCLSDDGSIILSNCLLRMDQDFTFSRGSFLIDKNVSISGTAKFNYTTALSSTFGSYALLYLDQGVTFSYAPRNFKNNLLYFTDKTSGLYLDNAKLHAVKDGLQLTTGSLYFDNKVTLSSEGRNSNEALLLGNSLEINVLSGAFIDLYGQINYS